MGDRFPCNQTVDRFNSSGPDRPVDNAANRQTAEMLALHPYSRQEGAL
ncbi:MAG TPA: hypothetical protein VH186_15115 [Chloroflexia bacterium]|nr:hypothetical protein [Chloroflexia bacterium]